MIINCFQFKNDHRYAGKRNREVHPELGQPRHADVITLGSNACRIAESNGNHHDRQNKDGDICQGGNVFTRKKLWTLGNYSFFIRPGWKRIDLTGADDLGGVFASAFASPDGKKVAVVAANVSYEPADFDFSLSGKGSDGLKKVSAFRTSESSDLANQHIDPKFDGKRTFKLSPRSVTTLLFE